MNGTSDGNTCCEKPKQAERGQELGGEGARDRQQASEVSTEVQMKFW